MHNNVRISTDSFEFYSWGPVMYPVNPWCTIQVIGGDVREVHSDSEVA